MVGGGKARLEVPDVAAVACLEHLVGDAVDNGAVDPDEVIEVGVAEEAPDLLDGLEGDVEAPPPRLARAVSRAEWSRRGGCAARPWGGP